MTPTLPFARGSERNGFLVALARLSDVADDIVCEAQVGPGRRQLWIELDRPAAGSDCLVRPTKLDQGVGQIAVGFGELGIEGDGLTTGGNCLVQQEQH